MGSFKKNVILNKYIVTLISGNGMEFETMINAESSQVAIDQAENDGYDVIDIRLAD